MLNLPNAVFLDVVVSVAGLDLVTSGTHSELIDASVGRPGLANVNLSFNDFSFVTKGTQRGIRLIF